MEMNKPAHPGEVLRELYLDQLGISITDAAKALGVTRKSLSELVNSKSGVSTTMALRLSKAFGTTPELWLNMQRNYDLLQIRNNFSLSQVKVLISPDII